MNRPTSPIRDERAEKLQFDLGWRLAEYAEIIEWQGGFQRVVDANTVWDVRNALQAVYKGRYLTDEYFEVKKALTEARSAVQHLAETMSRIQWDKYDEERKKRQN